MKPKTKPARLEDVSARRSIWILGAFVAIVALMGGGSRYDILSVPLLRAFAIFVAFAAIALIPSQAWRGMRVPLVLLTALAIWMGIQLIPLSPDLWSGLPLRGQIFAIDQLLGASDRWRPISMTPSLTVNSLLSLCVPFAALLVAAVLPAGQRVRLWWAIWALGVASVVFGLLQIMGGPRSIFYLYRITNDMSPVGLFANRNHHALMLSLSILAAGWLISNEVLRRNRRPLLIPAMIGSIVVFLLFTLIIGSRMGLVGGAASAILVYAVVRWSYRFEPKPINQASARRGGRAAPPGRGNRAKRIVLTLLPFVLIAGLATLFYFSGRENAVGRLFDGDGVEEIRVATFGTITAMVKQQWLFGTGFGSFARVYQVTEPDSLLREAYFNQAHNDWFQLLIEGGLPAALIFVGGVAWIASLLISTWRARPAPIRGEMAEAVMLAAAFALLIAGAAVDYPLRVPSIMMIAAFLIVILVRYRDELFNSNHGAKSTFVT
jgi:O-antigen ligase